MIKLITEVEAEQAEAFKKEQEEKSKLFSKSFPLPVYHTAIYPKFYQDPKWFNLFRSRFVNNLVSLFSRDRIINSFIEEIFPRTKVLQMGVSFGDEIMAIADQVGLKGRFDVIDINNTQLTLAQENLGDSYPQVNFYHYDAEDPLPEKYDTIICWMLLHEVPIATKINIVNNALNSIKENGQVIFVDYGRPNILHPLAYFVRMFNRLYQPFAEKLWDREIASYAEKDLDYSWKKQKFLGGMYQRVIVRRKTDRQRM